MNGERGARERPSLSSCNMLVWKGIGEEFFGGNGWRLEGGDSVWGKQAAMYGGST